MNYLERHEYMRDLASKALPCLRETHVTLTNSSKWHTLSGQHSEVTSVELDLCKIEREIKRREDD